MNERFTILRIQEISKAVADFFGKEHIKNVSDLERRVGCEFVGLREPEFIAVTVNPSNRSTVAYTVSYIVQGSGIPVEVKMNPRLEYSLLIAKAEQLLAGFTPFAIDPNANRVQNKHLPTLDIGEISEALRSIRGYARG